MGQHCWDLLRPFAHHSQHGRHNSQHCWPKLHRAFEVRAYSEGEISKSSFTAPRLIPFSFCPSYFFRFNFPNSFLTPLRRIYWASFWFENFLQNAERERVVETSRWVVEHEQEFLLEFFFAQIQNVLGVFLAF